MRWVMFAAAALIAACPAAADQTGYGDGRHVRDLAGVLDDATRSRLADRLEQAQQRYGPQVGIVTVKSLDGKPIAEFAVAYAEQWQLGSLERDDGLLIAVAPNDHETIILPTVHMTTNYPREWCEEVLQKALLPQFGKKDFGGGLTQAVDMIVARMAQYPTLPVTAGAAAPAAGAAG